VTGPDVKRYLVRGDPDGRVLVLRGHGAMFARITVALGVVIAGLAVYAVVGVIKKPSDEIALAVALAAGLAGPALFVGALWRLRHPHALLTIDKDAQTLQVTRHGQALAPIRFPDLGTMTLGSIGYTIHYSGGGRGQGSEQAIRLTNHPEVILYEPATDRDMVRFVATLRHVVGEQYLPRAEKKPRADAQP
jgi:hypothetical protein